MIIAVDNNKRRLAETVTVLRRMFPNESIILEQDPFSALRYACHNHVDIMFASLDMMPMDGIQFSQIIKRVKNNIKVYITSAPSNIEDEFIFEDEADGFLTEPLTEQGIKNAITNKFLYQRLLCNF